MFEKGKTYHHPGFLDLVMRVDSVEHYDYGDSLIVTFLSARDKMIIDHGKEFVHQGDFHKWKEYNDSLQGE